MIASEPTTKFVLTLAWWHLPAVCTVLAILWALFWPADDRGVFGGITRMFMLMIALAVIAVAWAIAGALK